MGRAIDVAGIDRDGDQVARARRIVGVLGDHAGGIGRGQHLAQALL